MGGGFSWEGTGTRGTHVTQRTEGPGYIFSRFRALTVQHGGTAAGAGLSFSRYFSYQQYYQSLIP